MALDPATVKSLKDASERYGEEFPVMAFLNKDGKWVLLHDSHIDELEAAFPDANVERELAKAYGWLEANPDRGKRNIRRFIYNWLSGG